MKRLRAASEQEIAEVRGIPADVAKAVHETLVAWMPSVPGRRQSNPKTKHEPKQLIYMIASFSTIYFAMIACWFRVLLTLKRLTNPSENPAILRVDED